MEHTNNGGVITMRIAETKKYNSPKKQVHKVFSVVPEERRVVIMQPKHKVKFIKKVEMLVRSSQEYKFYVEFLKKNVDMTQCSFFTNINNRNGRKVRIEIHHEPFTLYDLVEIVMDKWSSEGRKLSHLGIAEEVMEIHYRGLVGLIPLSLTVHQLVHDGKLFIPIPNVYGRVLDFVKEYEPYISEDLMSMLKTKIQMSKETQDTSVLDTSYIYVEVDGFTFPEKIQN